MSVSFNQSWGPCKWAFGWPLTDKAKDVSDGRDEDDQHVVKGQDGSGDQHVAGPAELTAAEQQCRDGGADLRGDKSKVDIFISSIFYFFQILTTFYSKDV